MGVRSMEKLSGYYASMYANRKEISTMMKSFKYRLFPTRKQVAALQFTLDRNRELYNAALEERREAWRMSRVSISYNMQSAQLPEIKEIRPEYKEIHSQVLQDTLKRVDKAFKGFFFRLKKGQTPGYPRFQGRDRYDSFCYPQAGFSIENGRLALSKIGHIKIRLHRPVEGQIKTCTIKREGDCWYVCFACEVEDRKKLPYTDLAIGLDLGLLHFATDSNGQTIDNPRYLRKAEQKLARLQQALSRKKRGSKRRKKSAKQVGKAHRKVRNQRKDFLHKQSRILVDTFETIVFEDLAPANLSKRPKAKQDESGKYLPNGASAKAGLNKSINDAGWSMFVALCRYKAAYAGTTVLEVNPRNTSQICSSCGEKGPHKDLSVRTHTCIHCGVVLDRDHNAAINILKLGLGQSLQESRS
jgi:putative transposase